MIKGIKYISQAETAGYGLSAVAYIRALRAAGYRPVTRAGQARAVMAAVTGVDDAFARFTPGSTTTWAPANLDHAIEWMRSL